MPTSFVTRAGPSLNLPSESVIVKEMRILLLSLITALALPAEAADPPSKRGGGLFGFGAPPAEQISSGLFPETGASMAPKPGLSSTGTRQMESPQSAEGIFRSGEPQRVAPVSYVIENGRRVERPVTTSPVSSAPEASPVEKPVLALQPLSPPASEPLLAATGQGAEKKRGFLGFGKKEQEAADPNPVVPPVPPATPILAATPIASPATPVAKPAPAAKPVPVAKPEAPAAVEAPASSNVKVETPTFAGVKPEKEKSSWIPFLGRKKNEEIPAAPPAPVVATPAMVANPAPAANNASPVSAKPVNQETATYEIRRDDSKPSETKKEEKTDREGGILSPIAKIRPRKELDLTGAETIIANGEIVKETSTPGPTLTAAPEAPATGPRQAPQVVNGVKTYTSWDDVNARSSSAADRIIGGMR
jgi:hypothetical protein